MGPSVTRLAEGIEDGGGNGVRLNDGFDGAIRVPRAKPRGVNLAVDDDRRTDDGADALSCGYYLGLR